MPRKKRGYAVFDDEKDPNPVDAAEHYHFPAHTDEEERKLEEGSPEAEDSPEDLIKYANESDRKRELNNALDVMFKFWKVMHSEDMCRLKCFKDDDVDGVDMIKYLFDNARETIAEME